MAGNAFSGEWVYSDGGQWDGAETSLDYVWLRCDASGAPCDQIGDPIPWPAYPVEPADVGSRLKLRATASNAEGSTSADSPLSDLVGEARPPSSVSPPSVIGSPGAYSGEWLWLDAGSWQGAEPLDFTYRWYSCVDDDCSEIEGATDTGYLPSDSDVGTTLKVKITVANGVGTAVEWAESDVVAAGRAPISDSPPTIGGHPYVGEPLTADPGWWLGAQPIDFAYQWFSCASECDEISGATDGQYVPRSGDEGRTLRVRVTATNALGSDVAWADGEQIGAARPPQLVDEISLSEGGTPAPDGLVGAWGFDEGSGSSVDDRSGSGNDGSVSGPTWTPSGKFGAALSFDGTDDRVVVPDSPSLDLDDGMTLEAWVKPNTMDGHWQTVLLKEWNNDFLVYDISTGDGGKPFGAAYMYNDDSLAIPEAPNALAENTWTHLAATYDGSNLRFYVNGTEVASEPASGPIQTTSGDLTIGGTAVFSDQWFDGLIDEVRVYDRALTATEIDDDQDTPISSITADTTAPAVDLSGAFYERRAEWLDSGELGLHVAATDAGSGVASAELVIDGMRREFQQQSCPNGGCPLDQTWSIDVGQLAEGPHLVQVLVLDGAGLLTQSSWNALIDHSAPTLDLSGPLAEAAGGEISDDANLHVAAADPDGAGVTSVEVLLDGQSQDRRDQSCPNGGCALELDWLAEVDGLAEGPHTVQITAADGAAHSSERELHFDLRTQSTPEAPALDPTQITPFADQTSFLYDGSDPVQAGVADGTIEPTRAAVVRGKVGLRNGEPLAGVKATVVDHPEFGETESRADGEIYMAVNGGGPLTVRLERQGYLPVDRQVEVPWQGYVYFDDVTMIEPDPNVTDLELGDPLAGMQVHRGRRIDDGAGERQATLLFPAGVEATMEMPDGSTQPLWDMHVRATEYTVGDAGPSTMPAPLPPTSGYTYAADFSVDEARAAGAEHVRFSQPVIGYLENFTHAPVGGRVPNGYYEPSTSQWVPDTDGRVVKVLSEQDGSAALDVTGSGQPASAADLAAIGIGQDELRKVAELYEPGQELWRVPTDHFSDWNFSFVLIGRVLQPAKWLIKKAREHWCGESGSVIECENQTLGELVPLTGTGLSLHYRSDRVPGRRDDRYAMDVPLVDDEVPAGLEGVELKIEVAGRKFEWTGPGHRFSPEPNLTHHFEWDGRDAFGRVVQGAQKATIQVGYTYAVQYKTDPVDPADRDKGFGVPPNGAQWTYFSKTVSSSGPGGGSGPGTVLTEPPTVTVWQDVETTLGGWDAREAGLGGWTLSSHHQYDPVAKTLYRGDGTRQQSESVNRVIERFVGPGQGGNGWSAPSAPLLGPQRMDVGPDGSLYVPEFHNDTVKRIRPDGVTEIVAGIPREVWNQPWQFSGDGGPATQARLASPTDVDVGPDGSLYITDYGNQRIRRVYPNGIIDTVVGGGQSLNGDSIPALQAQLVYPSSSAVAPDGTLYVGDRYGRVLRIGPDGLANRYAGGGSSTTDDTPARQQHLYRVNDVDLAPDGTLYIAEGSYWTGEIYRVTPDGLMRRVAGHKQLYENTPPENRTTAPALEANIDADHVSVAPDGSVHLTDHRNNKLWRLDPDGMLRVEIGGGHEGQVEKNGDGGPARLAGAADLAGITFAPDGAMFVSDNGYGNVRRVGETMSGFTGQDLALPSADGAELYRFDETGRHLETRNTATGTLVDRFDYDSAGRLSGTEDADGNELTIEHDAQGRPTAIVAPFGQRTELSVDGAGWLDSIRDPAQRSTDLQYGTDGLLTELDLPGGRTSTFDYSPGGRLVRDQNADGGFKTLERTSDGRFDYEVKLSTKLGRVKTTHLEEFEDGGVKRTSTDAAGIESVTTIGEDGSSSVERGDGVRLTQQLSPDPRFGLSSPFVGSLTIERPSGARSTVTQQQTVDLANPDDPLSVQRIEATTTTNGRAATATWDRAAGTLTTELPSGRSEEDDFDSRGRLVAERVPGLNEVSYHYDDRGRPVEVREGARSTLFAYDEDGWLESVTDPLQRTVEYQRDTLGRVTSQTLPGGAQVAFDYDDAGNLTRITPPGRPAHVFGHSLLGLRTDWTPPAAGGGSGSTGYRYDDDQALAAVLRPDGTRIDLDRDDGGRLAAVRHPGGRIDFAREPESGEPASVAVLDGQRVEWDHDGTVATAERAIGEVQGETRQTRDGEGKLTESTVVGTPAIPYAYDLDSLLRQAGDLSLSRDAANGLMTGTELGPVSTSLDYDGFGDLESLTAGRAGTDLFVESVDRDAGGRITTKTETIDGETHTIAYGYDAAGRLETVRRDGTLVVTYGYDANGNRVSEQPAGGAAITATFDDRDRLLSRGTVDYDFDAAGVLRSRTDTTNGETTSYHYDALGGLTAVELADGRQVDYVLDGLGRRVAKKVDGQLRFGLLYGEAMGPSAQLDADGSVRSRFVYGTRSTVPDYMLRDGHRFRIVSDDLGSPRLVVDVDSGEVVQRLDYDAFGRVVRDTNPGFQPFGFAGGLYDADTGLVRFGARDYDPETGRWTAQDPIDFAAGDSNLYGYVLGDPVNLVDPSGLYVETAIDAGFVVYDITTLALGCGSWGSLALDTGGIFVPGIAGLGHADELLRATKAARRSLPKRGKPNSTDVLDWGNGKGQIRDYGPDGEAMKDFDFGHDHGAGDPHAHDWADGVRQPGRPIGPGE